MAEFEKYIGVDAFGLCDAVSSSAQPAPKHSDFVPASVILSASSRVAPIVGQAAKANRTQIGFPYPLSSSLKDDEITLDMNRAMVSLIWKKLMLGNETNEKWGEGYCTKLLTDHVENLIKSRVSNFSKDSCIALAIPNFINEYAQEYLLQNLKRKFSHGEDNVKLIWRTVAAAIYWLNNRRSYSKLAELFKDGGRLGVLYLGLDSVEYASFTISEDQGFLVPKRELPQPGQRLELDGFDLFEASAADYFNDLKFSLVDRWQMLNICGEAWPTLLGMETEDKQHVLYFKGRWRKLLNPQLNRSGSFTASPWLRLLDCRAEIGQLNQHLFHSSAQPQRRFSMTTWRSRLQEFLRRQTGFSKVRACIVTGPLSSPAVVKSLADALNRLYCGEQHATNGFWYTEEDDIAGGAAVFAERYANDLPTYNDQLMQLSLFVKSEGRTSLEPVPLIAQDIQEKGWPAGKEVYKNTLNKFALAAHSALLPVKLAKGNFERNSDTNELRAGTVKFKKVSSSQIPLTTKIEIAPASGFAKITFAADPSLKDVDESLKAGAKFNFDKMKVISNKDLDITDELAYPGDKDYPPITDVTQDMIYVNNAIEDFNSFLKRKFLNARLEAKNMSFVFRKGVSIEDKSEYRYQNNNLIKSCNNLLEQLPDRKDFTVKFKENKSTRYLFDQYGNIGAVNYQAEYEQVLKNILSIFHVVWDDEKLSIYPKVLKKIIIYYSYLRTKSPSEIKDYLIKVFKEDPTEAIKADYWRMAARLFTEKEDFELIFKFFNDQTEFSSTYKLAHAKALAEILDNYPAAKECLSESCAKLMITRSIQLMKQELKNKNVKTTFFGAAYLIFCALKYRCKDETFMQLSGPQESENRKTLDNIIEIINNGIQIVKNERKSNRTEKMINNLTKLRENLILFFEKKGSNSAIELIREFTEADDDSKDADDAE